MASVPRNNCSESFETFTEMPLHSGCYLRNTLGYFVCSVVGWHFPGDIFLYNVRGILGIVNLLYTSVRLLLKCSNLLMMITLIALFLKLYIFRQNLDNFIILVESLYGNMLHD